MLITDNVKFKTGHAGLFTTDKEWIHPVICEKTYEIIYVTEGVVHLFEGEKKHTLKESSLIILKPGTVHGGSEKSTGRTSFYWLHFHIDGIEINDVLLNNFGKGFLFREFLHERCSPGANGFFQDAFALYIISEILSVSREEETTALSKNVSEYVRINSGRGLTVKKVAGHFGYNSEHLSRIVKKDSGLTLKELIDSHILSRAKNYLLNTSFSVKEIAALLGYPDPNTFINFFKYHEKKSPTAYRNAYFNVEMNNK